MLTFGPRLPTPAISHFRRIDCNLNMHQQRSHTHLVLIPSYNPGAKVVETVNAAREKWNPVWVVVDGSTDGSAELLRELAATDAGLEVFELPTNQGKGAALRRAVGELRMPFALVQDAGYAVALDLQLDDELRAEGFARELVRYINDQRKQLGFAIADRIETTLEIAPEAIAAATTHLEYIKAETLSVAASLSALDGDSDQHVAGHLVRVALRVVNLS